jgi:hypothetical protein
VPVEQLLVDDLGGVLIKGLVDDELSVTNLANLAFLFCFYEFTLLLHAFLAK